ncbi:hypothetical protein ACWGCI_01935 [Streptomyces sp. NPDC054949]
MVPELVHDLEQSLRRVGALALTSSMISAFDGNRPDVGQSGSPELPRPSSARSVL